MTQQKRNENKTDNYMLPVKLQVKRKCLQNK
jgi:hypothetical protein